MHGGPDARGAALWDFSTNANACGPCPQALQAVRAADATRYPDPSYAALRTQLAVLHGVAPQRIVLAASASEFIFRISACMARAGATRVSLPAHHYGDYAVAARACGLQPATPGQADLSWACDPTSPLGADEPVFACAGVCVLDRAYAPLRLQGASAWEPVAHQVWQLWTPNKALGLTGVRAAYAIAPIAAGDAGQAGEAGEADQALRLALEAACPSWPVGAHGVAMLQAWCQPAVQAWVAACLPVLRTWKVSQLALCEAQGWRTAPSVSNFFCAQGVPVDALRAAGIAVRDAASFGLPGWARLSVQPPAAQAVLDNAATQRAKAMR